VIDELHVVEVYCLEGCVKFTFRFMGENKNYETDSLIESIVHKTLLIKALDKIVVKNIGREYRCMIKRLSIWVISIIG